MVWRQGGIERERVWREVAVGDSVNIKIEAAAEEKEEKTNQ